MTAASYNRLMESHCHVCRCSFSEAFLSVCGTFPQCRCISDHLLQHPVSSLPSGRIQLRGLPLSRDSHTGTFIGSVQHLSTLWPNFSFLISAYVSVYQFIRYCICDNAHLFVCSSIYPSVWMSIHLSQYLSIFLFCLSRQRSVCIKKSVRTFFPRRYASTTSSTYETSLIFSR